MKKLPTVHSAVMVNTGLPVEGKCRVRYMRVQSGVLNLHRKDLNGIKAYSKQRLYDYLFNLCY